MPSPRSPWLINNFAYMPLVYEKAAKLIFYPVLLLTEIHSSSSASQMAYTGITRLSIGQHNSTVKLNIGEGEHKLLPGSDFPSIITLKGDEPVVPQYLDKFDPAAYGSQKATVTSVTGDVRIGFLFGSINSSYELPTLVGPTTTTVYKKWASITYEAPLKPARIVAGKDENLTLIYNTHKVMASPVYKAYVHDGKLIRIEMMLSIRNDTGVVLQFAPNAELIFKVSDPTAAPDNDFHQESVRSEGVMLASVSCAPMSSSVATVVKSGEMLTFKLDKAAEIPIGNSTRVLRIIKADEFTAEKYLWYRLDTSSMVWGFSVQFRTALPCGKLYVIEQGTWDSIGTSNIMFPMIVPGKAARLHVAPVNDRIRPVKKVKNDKTTVYEISPNGDTDIKTVYTLAAHRMHGRITPTVPIVDGLYEFPANVGTVLVDDKDEK